MAGNMITNTVVKVASVAVVVLDVVLMVALSVCSYGMVPRCGDLSHIVSLLKLHNTRQTQELHRPHFLS